MLGKAHGRSVGVVRGLASGIAFEICFLLMMMMMTRNKQVLPIRQHPHEADDLQKQLKAITQCPRLDFFQLPTFLFENLKKSCPTFKGSHGPKVGTKRLNLLIITVLHYLSN
jgi:hypothetical protein